MIIEFDRSFKKSLDQLQDKSLFKKIEALINSLEASNSLSEIPNIKKLSGYKTYYRVRTGDY
jgi:mRNA interferase RelE/StbE